MQQPEVSHLRNRPRKSLKMIFHLKMTWNGGHFGILMDLKALQTDAKIQIEDMNSLADWAKKSFIRSHWPRSG